MLEEIEQQMAWLWLDTSTPQDPYASVPELTEEDLAMFGPGGEFDVTQVEAQPEVEAPVDEMPAYDMEELKMDISPMLSWLPKAELADLIIWIWQERNNFNSNNEANNA